MRGFLEHRIEATATGRLNPYWFGPDWSLGLWKTVLDTCACLRQQALHPRRTAHLGRGEQGRLSSCSRRRLLGAFPNHRRGSATRRGWDRILQFVPGDGEYALLFSPVPIRERGGLDLEGKSLVCRVDG